MSGSAPAPEGELRETASPEETGQLGAGLASALGAGDVLSLTGPLGGGKTCFVAGLARGLGCTGRVRSPSFTLVNEYGGEIPLLHLDLYRLEGSEADGLGLDEGLERGVLAVEWGEKLPAYLRTEALTLAFEIRSERARVIRATASGTRGLALLAAWSALGASTEPAR
jgi:tRNA threonylcarbamoyladenosine biosynthesis protein TsaE